MRTPGTHGSLDASNWGKVINGPLGGRNVSQVIALGVVAIVLSIMMMIIAPPQDTTHHSADAGDFASSSATVAGPWGVVFTKPSGQGVRLVE